MSNLKHPDHFVNRHIGPKESELSHILSTIGVSSVEELIAQTVPSSIRLNRELNLPEAMSEYEYLKELRLTAAQNQVFRSFIGMGYYDTITPSVILRNIFENPGWYTQYTPYQAEISQGRMESLLNYQTMVSDLTGLPVANASLLDEGTAAAEAMFMTFNQKNKNKRKGEELSNLILVSENCLPQTISILETRASAQGIEVKVCNILETEISDKVFAIVAQYPNQLGTIEDYEALAAEVHAKGSFVIACTDLMALTLLKSPGEWGADVAVGNSQRFGVPMGFGGPHAAFFAVKEEFLRSIPGRIIGVSIDAQGNRALRMTLQTREQHIRRDKATSNICTAQALLANMAAMYAVYHGPDGLKKIATRIHALASILNKGFQILNLKQINTHFFDTLVVDLGDSEKVAQLKEYAENTQVNFRYFEDNKVGISLDECTSAEEVSLILNLFAAAAGLMLPALALESLLGEGENALPAQLVRTSAYLTHPVFNTYRSETAMMRYIKKLENKDLSLNRAMIPLGSCTMKLNAATQLMPVSWAEFGKIHPFVPQNQVQGYHKIIEDLASWLNEITGFAGTSFQPNSGAQGEYAGLMVIRAYHQSRGDFERDIMLIPASAHGTNPASAVMAGFKVVVTKVAEDGTIDMEDFRAKAAQYSANLGGAMITYPSTHGVFEETIKELCNIVHENGGQLYMDGANMNAQVGLTGPGYIGADVCHLNLHKTFAIPHGGGGPGVGPICVAAHLVPFLPGHEVVKTGGEQAVSAVSAAPFGSASILLISYAYCKMLGKTGLRKATEYAILNANYMKARLESTFKVLYTGDSGHVAHEFILDLREFKQAAGLEVDDITKRLIDYGFHAPTVSWPVPGTIMIEPTESEPLAELDRFCDAMLSIHGEIKEILSGTADKQDNVLKNAPHIQSELISDAWNHSYSREKAAYPVASLLADKCWATVKRVDNAYGDRNVVCTCPPIEEYAEVN